MTGKGRRDAVALLAPSALVCMCFLLPTASPALFFWLNLIMAVPVFMLLQMAGGRREAAAQLRNGLLPAVVAALTMGRVAFLMVSLTMLPLGWSLHRSARQGIPPALAGGIGALVLSLSWAIVWLGYGLTEEANPYVSLLKMLENGMDQFTAAYRSSPDLPADILYHFELMATWLRDILARVLPGLLAGAVLLTVWLNMTAGSYILRRVRPEQAPWPEYQFWQLPDRLIWVLIAAVLFALATAGGLQNAGFSLIIVMTLLYFFQGLAVLIHLLRRWNVPLFLRIVLYLTVTAHLYGVLLLAVAGVADTWGDFRKLARPADGS